MLPRNKQEALEGMLWPRDPPVPGAAPPGVWTRRAVGTVLSTCRVQPHVTCLLSPHVACVLVSLTRPLSPLLKTAKCCLSSVITPWGACRLCLPGLPARPVTARLLAVASEPCPAAWPCPSPRWERRQHLPRGEVVARCWSQCAESRADEALSQGICMSWGNDEAQLSQGVCMSWASDESPGSRRAGRGPSAARRLPPHCPSRLVPSAAVENGRGRVAPPVRGSYQALPDV